MNTWKKTLPLWVLAVAALMTATPVAAQDRAELERGESKRDIVLQMRDAERQLELAAQRIAELSGEHLARLGELERRLVIESDRPVLGITIGSDDKKTAVKGVTIMGVSPGGAADEADLRATDIIVSINGESFKGENGAAANRLLLDFMRGVEAGDVLQVEYLRDDKRNSVDLTPTQMHGWDFNFGLNFDGADFDMPGIHTAPMARVFAWSSRHGGHGFGEMEIVSLNKSLGRYFGTDSGLLIIKAPEDNAYQLQDGDVIKNIDGREPKDISHAVRILASYQSGETVKIEIMRDKRNKTLVVEIPDNRRSHEFRAPLAAPVSRVVIAPRVRVLRSTKERT